MPSFEEEDERISSQRALRRVRHTSGRPQSNSQRQPTRSATARRSPSPVVEAQDFYGNPAVEVENGAEDDENDVLVTPEPTRKTQKRRATASVSFSEPVETPQRPVLQPQQPSHKEPPVDAPRSRNRLETRLAELQRDVANLSLRLRASGSDSQRVLSMDDDDDEDDDREVTGTSVYSTDDSRLARKPMRRIDDAPSRTVPAAPLRAKPPTRTILKTSKSPVEPRRVASKSPSRASARRRDGESWEDSREGDDVELRIHRDRGLQPQQQQQQQQAEPQPRSTREMLRAVRDLRVVAVERDQLRFELEQTRKALVAMEKKFTEAFKWKAAYDKMKAHCDSLQESLDLSEKIRVRQKKLLQQLQQSLKQDEDAARRSGHVSGKAAQRVDVLDSILDAPSKEPPGYQPQVQTQRPKRRAVGDVDTSRLRTTRATQLPGAPSSRPAASAGINTSVSRSFSKSDFDSLLQIPLRDRSMAGSTLQRTATRMNDSRLYGASSRPARTNTSTQPVASRPSKTRAAAPPAPRTNHFLAPTQASLNHAAKRKPDGIRRPFVV